jgi:hypothetical protein
MTLVLMRVARDRLHTNAPGVLTSNGPLQRVYPRGGS